MTAKTKTERRLALGWTMRAGGLVSPTRRVNGRGYAQHTCEEGHPAGQPGSRGLEKGGVKWEVYEHRLVAAEMLGRPLQGEECVHHIDRDKTNNARTNLYICDDAAEHRQIHKEEGD